MRFDVKRCSALWALVGLVEVLCAVADAASVETARIPGEGIQPCSAIDRSGVIHLVYFEGDPSTGDLYYRRRGVGSVEFSKPVRVNATDGAAAAFGVIRAAQMTVAPDGRVHVAWVGSRATAKSGADGGHPEHPLLYTRSNIAGTAFEEERNLLTRTGHLDGGGSVAVDSAGNVFVAWHGSAPDNDRGELGRAMFVAVSVDGGESFSSETQANPLPTGSCACCSIRAYVDSDDRLRLLYRGANPESRDMMLLTSEDAGRSFTMDQVNRWATQACPLSSASMADDGGRLFVVSEVGAFVELARFDPGGDEPRCVTRVSTEEAKFPSLATNEDGEVLVAWVEDAGWGQGGTVKWRLFDADGVPKGAEVTGGELAPWSFPAVEAGTGDRFVVVW